MRLFTLVAVLSICAGTMTAAGDLSGYFPRSGETPGWKAVEPVVEYIGDDLFQMIDGGAEVYREYGFVRAGSQEIVDDAGHSIMVELYEMSDPGAAYGIFTFKTRGEGRDVQVGNGGRQTDYYLNYWKGKYLATLTGSDTTATTRAGLKTLGGVIEKKITETGEPASLAGKIGPTIEGQKPAVTYVRGPIARNNFYRFGAGDMFACKEGYVADYGRFTTVVFVYDSDAVCRSRFETARTAFAGDSTFSMDKRGPMTSAERFLMSDRRGKSLVCARTGIYLVVAVGRSEAETQTAADGVLARLRQSEK
jgi:hypothetical protein